MYFVIAFIITIISIIVHTVKRDKFNKEVYKWNLGVKKSSYDSDGISADFAFIMISVAYGLAFPIAIPYLIGLYIRHRK